MFAVSKKHRGNIGKKSVVSLHNPAGVVILYLNAVDAGNRGAGFFPALRKVRTAQSREPL